MNDHLKPTIPIDSWNSAIDSARRRRDARSATWREYALLHTNAYAVARQANDTDLVTLPNGDQVKVALVYRNIEQTMALLEVPEIGVRATATDFTHELGEEDTHREAVVEAALVNSLYGSDLFREDIEEVDDIKRDGVIIGHGINYTHYMMLMDDVEVEQIPLLSESDSGAFMPLTDELGQPRFESKTERQVVYQACQDECISPLEFLFDVNSNKISRSPFHGYERPISLDKLRKDPRYTIPEEIEGTTLRLVNLYGRPNTEEGEFLKDAVNVIVIWDKLNRELITFIEHDKNITSSKTGKKKKATENKSLIPIAVMKWPVEFENPEDSPFSFFIPIPARDDPFGISQVEHIKNPATEADKLRTRAANLTRQVKLVWLYQRGTIDQDDLSAALKAPEAEPVGVDLPEGVKFEDIVKELNPNKIPKEIYEQLKWSEEDVRKIEGIAEIPFGGAETATESENQMNIGGARPQRKRRRLMSFLSTVARRHLAYLRKYAPEGQSIPIITPDGYPKTITYGRQSLFGQFKIEVLPGGGATNVSPVKQKAILELGAMLFQKFGAKFDAILLRQLLTQFDIRDQNTLAQAAMEATMQGLVPPQGGGTAPAAAPQPASEMTNGQVIRQAVNSLSEGGPLQ